METAIVTIICLALVIFGGMAMSNGFITSLDTGTAGLEEINSRNDTLMRTELSPVSANTSVVSGPDPLDIILDNSGQIKMADFEKWDVIVQYLGEDGQYYVEWLPYVEGTTNKFEWDVGLITMNGQTEVFEPGVLNPGEQVTLRAWLDPSLKSTATGMVTVSTPGGITCSTYFTP
jgi:hypothetical protein